MCAAVEEALRRAGLTAADCASIGIARPVPATRRPALWRGRITSDGKTSPSAGCSRSTSVAAHLGNDANCAALAEVVAGAAAGRRDVVLITLGTGVGGGIIIGGKIYAGMRGAGAELGHTVLVLDGEPCTCGRRGCWEAYASATALIRQTREAAVQNPQSLLAQVPAEQINGRTVFDAADRGDAAAQRVIDRYCEYIAAGMTDIVNALAPEMILLGGGVSRQGERLLAPIREYIATHCFGQREGAIPVVAAAQLGNDAGIIGAAAL